MYGIPMLLYLAQLDAPLNGPSLEELSGGELGTANPSVLSEGAIRILDVGRETSADIARGFDPLWQQSMQGGLYQAMADVGVLVAVIALCVFLVQWWRQLTSGDGDLAFSELIWPLIVIGLLSNNGAVLSTATLELRNIGNTVNETVLSSTVRDISLQQQYQNTNLGAAIADAEAVSISECRENFQGRRARPQQACIQQARETATALRQQYGLEPVDVGWLRSALQALVGNLLFAIHYAFQNTIEIVLIITSLLGPLAVGLSLLPGASKALYSWLEGIFSVFLIKLTLNLIAGLAAYASSLQQTNGYSLILPILLGIFAPILSVLVGLQGGAAFFNAISTAGVYLGYGGAFRVGKKTAAGSVRATQKLRKWIAR